MMPITEMHAELARIDALGRQRAGERAAGFAARVLPLLEGERSRAVDGLGAELGGLGDAVSRAVGAGGGGGRRWRPLLTFAAARACGGDPAGATGVAVAVELTHTASLVLDDMPCMDDDPERRGLPATHRLVGPAGAILVSIGLLGRAAELLAASPRGAAGLCAEWGRCVGLRGMSGGQAADLAGWRTGACRRLLREKTTALSALAVTAGAHATGADSGAREALAAFGRALGWAYQLSDDADDEERDAAIGRISPSRAPRRHAARLLRLAEARLAATPGLSPDGAGLLVAYARSIVPAGRA